MPENPRGLESPAPPAQPDQEKRPQRAMVISLFWSLMTVAVMMVCPVFGTDKPVVLNNIGAVRISADCLTVPGGSENHAEFSGNVRAIGDRFEITADQLKIFYQPTAAETEKNIADGGALTKIIATGNVVITSGEKIAKTEQAVYDKNQQTIILTGEQSTVQQNNSYISGAKIIMHTDSEAVTVESDNGKRVEAFIEAGEIKRTN